MIFVESIYKKDSPPIRETNAIAYNHIKNVEICQKSYLSILLVRFLALVTTMVTMVDHGNHRSNDRGNDRSNHRGYYDRYYNVNA